MSGTTTTTQDSPQGEVELDEIKTDYIRLTPAIRAIKNADPDASSSDTESNPASPTHITNMRSVHPFPNGDANGEVVVTELKPDGATDTQVDIKQSPKPPAETSGKPNVSRTPSLNSNGSVTLTNNTTIQPTIPTMQPSVKPDVNPVVSPPVKPPPDDEGDEDDADGMNLSPEALQPLLSGNQYTVRKMAAQALMDVALMMANISQLRTLITGGPNLEYYYLLMVLVSFSLAAQILFAVIIYMVWMRETEENSREEFMSTIRQVAASKDPAAKMAQSSLRANLKAEREKQLEKFHRFQTTNRLNYGSVVLVFIITVTNMFITGFGIQLDVVDSTNASGIGTPVNG